MTKEEFLRAFIVEPQHLNQYVKYGIIDQTETISEAMIDDISLALSMEKARFPLETIKKFIEMSHHQNQHIEELNQILRRQRCILLEEIHEIQKNIDMIDYKIYSLKNKENV